MFHTRKIPLVFSLLTMLCTVALRGDAADPHSAAPAQTVKQKKIKMTAAETIVYVEDMHCKSCAKKIARKLYAVPGVKRVRSNVKGDYTIVTPQAKKKLDPQALWSAVQTAGFPVVKLVGPRGTYQPDPKTKEARRVETAPASAKKG